MDTNISVLIVNEKLEAAGIITNAAFVLGLTAGKFMPDESYGHDVIDGDGKKHLFLTKIGHYVRKATNTKIKTIRDAVSENTQIKITDYTEDAAPCRLQRLRNLTFKPPW